MKFFIYLILKFWLFVYGFKQGYLNGGGNALSNSFDSFSVTEMKYVPKLTRTDYLFSDWLLADVKLRIDSRLIKNVLIKMDITNKVNTRVSRSFINIDFKFKYS